MSSNKLSRNTAWPENMGSKVRTGLVLALFFVHFTLLSCTMAAHHVDPFVVRDLEMLKFFQIKCSDILCPFPDEQYDCDLTHKFINVALFPTGTDCYPPCRAKHAACTLSGVPIKVPAQWHRISAATRLAEFEMKEFVSVWKYLQFLSTLVTPLQSNERRAFLYRVLARALGYTVRW